MADFESMREKHRKDSIRTLSLCIFFVFIYVFHTHYISAFHDLMNDPTKFKEVFEKSWFILILTLVSPFVSYFLGIFTIAKRDFYYDIDNITFRTRKNIDSQICKDMLDLKSTLSEIEKSNLAKLRSQINSQEVCRKIMRVFYYFIEKPEFVNPQLKSHAFTYWGDYFSSLMYAFWGCLTILGALGIYIIDNSWSVLRLVISLLLVITVSLSIYSILKGKTRKRIISVPKTQIDEIHRNASDELLKAFRAENFFQS